MGTIRGHFIRSFAVLCILGVCTAGRVLLAPPAPRLVQIRFNFPMGHIPEYVVHHYQIKEDGRWELAFIESLPGADRVIHFSRPTHKSYLPQKISLGLSDYLDKRTTWSLNHEQGEYVLFTAPSNAAHLHSEDTGIEISLDEKRRITSISGLFKEITSGEAIGSPLALTREGGLVWLPQETKESLSRRNPFASSISPQLRPDLIPQLKRLAISYKGGGIPHYNTGQTEEDSVDELSQAVKALGGANAVKKMMGLKPEEGFTRRRFLKWLEKQIPASSTPDEMRLLVAHDSKVEPAVLKWKEGKPYAVIGETQIPLDPQIEREYHSTFSLKGPTHVNWGQPLAKATIQHMLVDARGPVQRAFFLPLVHVGFDTPLVPADEVNGHIPFQGRDSLRDRHGYMPANPSPEACGQIYKQLAGSYPVKPKGNYPTFP